MAEKKMSNSKLQTPSPKLKGQAVVEYLLVFVAIALITVVSLSAFYPKVKETAQNLFITAAGRIVNADE
ncbi:MAG: hypothetical protein KKH11_05545 [Candidatus Omnitrophica bacterium]|nr:hypothetical protein [Candidatus Omnitrophota bacterium]